MTKQEFLSSFNFKSERDQSLTERAYETLMGNIYEEDTYLWSPYKCASPCKSKFFGIWNWDSAFHAIGFSRWSAELARDSILGFFKFQEENGTLPDVAFTDNTVVRGFSKPPVFPWACKIVYERTGSKDKEFLKEMYPKLAKNINWWENARCKNGLFSYNADEDPKSADYLVHVMFESGWDNAVRWDNGITNLWALDLNCFMVDAYRALAFIAGQLGLSDDYKVWSDKEQKLVNLINEKMWDDENGYYGDTYIETGKVSSVFSPASFMPLYINISSEDRAAKMAKIAEVSFEGRMPTVSFDNPKYSNDYWRGPTWLNVAYFAAKGLKNYNFPVADAIKEWILTVCDSNKGGIYENYNSRTGEGLYCDKFCWSSVFIIEFIMNW